VTSPNPKKVLEKENKKKGEEQVGRAGGLKTRSKKLQKERHEPREEESGGEEMKSISGYPRTQGINKAKEKRGIIGEGRWERNP